MIRTSANPEAHRNCNGSSESVPLLPARSEDVSCPLCQYDLQGLSDPRCPECGYRFSWAELRDPNRRLHPYLFEHHPEANVRSFFKTVWHGLWPKTFWTTLHPSQPSRLRRLVIYFGFIAALHTSLLVGRIGGRVLRIRKEQIAHQAWLRVEITRALENPERDHWVNRDIQRLGSTDGVLAIHSDSRTLMEVLWGEVQFQGAVTNLMKLTVIQVFGFVLWPVCTLFALQVFHWSKKRARVQFHHILRCVVYGSDFSFWLALPIGASAFALALMDGTVQSALRWGAMLGALNVLVMAYRLVVAYRLYLRFDRPALTILASQAMVGFAILDASLFIHGYWWSGL